MHFIDLLNEADTIIIATDSDREGENIAWSIMTKTGINLKNKILKRLWINSLEKEAILDGFKNLKDGWNYYPAYKEAQHFLKTVKWEDIVDMENSHDALKYHGNGLYSDEYIKPSSYNPYQENTKILNNDKQQGLSQQYKNLNKQINNKPDNNQHLQTQLKEVRKKISQQTQKDLKDFAKANPDLKKPRAKKAQQTLQQ